MSIIGVDVDVEWDDCSHDSLVIVFLFLDPLSLGISYCPQLQPIFTNSLNHFSPRDAE